MFLRVALCQRSCLILEMNRYYKGSKNVSVSAERDKNLLPMLMSYYFGRLVAQKIHNTSIERV